MPFWQGRLSIRLTLSKIREGRGWRPSSGQATYKYEIKENWAKLPEGWSFKEAAAIGAAGHEQA
jgi:hypothetical protein